MADRSYGDQHKERENGTKERLVQNNQGLATSASQDRTRYVSYHINHQKRNEEEVDRLLATVSHKFKQTNEQREKEWTHRLENMQEKYVAIIKEEKLKNKQIKEELEIRDIKIKNLEEKLKKTELDFTDWNEMKKTLTDNKEPKLNLTEKELAEANSRLADNGKLTESNQNFVELSDIDRPSKMTEKYTELYDNQWTDAFIEIEKFTQTEEKAIRVLLEILMDVMRFCEQRAKSQMEKLQSDLTCSDNQSHDCVPYNVTKQLKDLRKVLATAAKDNLYQLYLSILKRSTDENHKLAMKIQPFVKECFEVCWFMVIQNPPIVLCTTGESGDSLDTDLYRAYTNSGRYIEFVVWPPMLLFESGPVLAKGVAQGKKDRHHQRSESAGATRLVYKQSTVPTMVFGTKQYVPNRRPKDKNHPNSKGNETLFLSR